MNNLYWILKLADEFEEYLKKPITKEFSDDEKLLLKYNLIPLPFSGKDPDALSFLGEGGSSNVYRILYKGKPAIAKITNGSVANITQKLYELSNKVGKYKKHIMQIYDIIKENNAIYIIICEELIPSNKHINDLFEGAWTKTSTKTFFGSLNVQFFIKLFHKLEIQKYLSIKQLISLAKESENYFNNIDIEKIRKSDYNFSIMLPKYMENIKLYNLPIKILNSLKDNLENYIINILNQRVYFPIDLNDFKYMEQKNKILPYQILPETKDFIEFLLFLYNKFNIKYSDIAGENIMQRPSTGDLVIVDPGNFT